jgi:hypothetical protein
VDLLRPFRAGESQRREPLPRPLAWAVLGRPFGAESAHSMAPRCPAKDMGKDQPLGRVSGDGAFSSRRRTDEG